MPNKNARACVQNHIRMKKRNIVYNRKCCGSDRTSDHKLFCLCRISWLLILIPHVLGFFWFVFVRRGGGGGLLVFFVFCWFFFSSPTALSLSFVALSREISDLIGFMEIHFTKDNKMCFLKIFICINYLKRYRCLVLIALWVVPFALLPINEIPPLSVSNAAHYKAC